MGFHHSKSLSSSTCFDAVIRARPKMTPEDIPSLQLIPHSVYASLSLHVYGNPDAPPIPSPWEVLLTATNVNLDKEGYFGIAYINKELRHCIIAQRGTTNALSLRAGVWTYFGERNILFSLARQFSKQVRLYLSVTRGETPEWFISYTGHSLGAVLAACRSVEERTYAITFESPGCKTFIEKTMSPLKAEDANIITYLRSPNPINSLRPQCGYVVQIPLESEQSNLLQPRTVPSSILRLPSIPSPQEFIRGQVPRVVGIPDIQQYVGKIEPLLREMLEHTQQVHAMVSIFTHFKDDDEPSNEQVVLRWPSTLMQFLEYYNAKKALEDPVNRKTNLSAAYESLMRDLYVTAERPKNSLPLRFLDGDSIRLLRLWWQETPTRLAKLPLTLMDHKVLNTITIEDECMCTSVLTAFQAKQYLSLLVFRPEIHKLITQLEFDPLLGSRSKL
ncbi:hypothetical protein C3747_357g14 [Trypanosoma cruzi]|uniref:Fungal lipase-like domain-containing protein n=2 Tax=Trypanosoma cruzi TaxID=5693 RepID=Q4DJG2_TRYCC|nr:hypothetical protein, conserved [Trypanosoma cruzi]EAN92675.1 hypothetical protein, conserved [Trypanosoma cruzi]KAF5225160.1 hypothetical protein ECC02_001705 [Trypanosoma cruzi]KAF8293329.1 hypothetical protein TcYC6_0110190 [Trypanosoma cruzi]PWU90682.1 hypothetical protein C3747_357g14 [Trypanosoma cruzi]RNC54527.1 hypothetical protein TcCL_ESM08028 [Trypanosoma cruzi]|eukprot:XP_814526.1 hypothetical protein [Trypanosoma cruzi strain CL Brener]